MRAQLQLSLALVALSGSPAAADRDLFERLCRTADCGGAFARLEVFRDAGQSLVKIRYRGDFRHCSHPPTVYYDERGLSLGSVDDWLRTGEQLAYATAFHAEQTKGLVRSEEIACRDFVP